MKMTIFEGEKGKFLPKMLYVFDKSADMGYHI